MYVDETYQMNLIARGFEPVSEEMKFCRDECIMPMRSTKTSAGYDFASPFNITILPKDKKLIWTDVKAFMLDNEVLILVPRSSIGIKKGLRLANTIGVIDADYYNNSDNEGNIGICLFNDNNYPVTIERGDRIAQGIFLPFLVADNCNCNTERTGGIGSSGK